MTDEPDIIRQLRKEEKRGLLHSKAGSNHDLKFVKQSPVEISDRDLVFIEPGATDSTMDDTLCNILLDDLYKVAFELSPDCIIILDVHGVVQSCNTRTETKLGWKKEELIGKHISKIGVFRQNDILERLKSFSAVLDGREIESFETEIVCRDGSSFFVEVRPILLKKDGKKIGVLVILRDITKNKKINQILHRYEKIIKTVKHPMSLIDKNYVYQTVNDAYLPFLNKSREEIEGHSVEEVLGKEFFEKQVKPYFDRCLAGEEVRYQVSFSTPDTEKRILEVEAYPCFDLDGAISGVVANTIDLTDQKKTAEGLVQSEKKYRELANSLPQIVYETDEHANFTFVNQASLSLTGYTEEDFKGLNALQTVAPIDRARAKNNILKILQGETITGNEYLMQRKDGSTFPVLFHSTPILHNNKIVGLRGFAVDITERKRVEEALRESEEKYRSVFNNFVDLYYQTDMQGLITNVSPSCFVLSGWKPEELIGHQVLELYPDPEQRKVLLEKLRREGAVSDYEITLLHRDRRHLSVSVSSHLIRDEQGNLKYVEGTIRDITERKKTEYALRKSEEQYRLVTENASDAIWIMDLNLRFTYISPSHEKMTGYTTENALKLSLNELLTVESMERTVQAFTAEMQLENNKEKDLSRSVTLELNQIKADGTIFPIEVRVCFLRDTHDNPVGVLGITRDITERKKGEEENRRLHELLQVMNKELERKVQDRTAEISALLKQKDEFIGQLGHDLKTPLTPLNILLPIVKEREQDPQLKEFLETIINNVRYMKNLVIKTLTLAQLNSPNTQLELRDIDLSIQIHDSLDLQRTLSEGKDIVFENNIPAETIVQVDLLQIRELFNNLISNAVKYSQEDEVKITIDAKEMDDFIVISVKDTGMGLDSDQIPHVFEEFYKADYSRHDLQSTGLGLSICKRIVEKHGGRIWVESQGKGKGSTFFFTLKPYKRTSGEENINTNTNELRINTVL